MNLARALASFVLLSSVPTVAQELAPFTAERSWQLERLGVPTLAPDGSFAICAVTRYDMASDKGLADLWLWRTDGSASRRLTTHVASEGAPSISPDGTRVLFVAERDGDKAPQLYVLPLDGGEARRVTSVPTGVAQPMWFQDGKRIAFLTRVWRDLDGFEAQQKRLEEREAAKSKALIWDAAPVTAWDVHVDDRELHLYAVTIEGGAVEPITLGTGLELPRRAVPLESPLYDVAPDGKEVAFTADSDPAANFTDSDVYTLALGSKQAVNRTQGNRASDAVPQYSRDGKWLAFARQSVVGFYGDTRKLMLLDRASGALRAVAPNWDRSADNLVWSADSKKLYGAIDDAGTVRAYEIPIDGAPRALTSSPSFGALAVAARAPNVLV
ncbi:MAG: S9 family peptidase, partial [Planctomycetota bacterium]